MATATVISSSLIPAPIRDTVIRVLIPHGVSQIRVFGSYTTGSQTQESDLDLIVSFHTRKDLFDLGGMREDLIDALGIPVDLLIEGAISPYLKNRVLDEAVVIYSEG